MAVCQNLVPLVNPKIAGKWMFIPLKMVVIGINMKTQSWKHHGRVSEHETSWMIRPGSPGAWLAAFPQRRSIPGFILDVLGNMNYMNWLESGYFMILHSKQAAQALMMVRVDSGRTCSYHIYPHIIRLCLKTWLTKLLWLIIVRPKKTALCHHMFWPCN